MRRIQIIAGIPTNGIDEVNPSLSAILFQKSPLVGLLHFRQSVEQANHYLLFMHMFVLKRMDEMQKSATQEHVLLKKYCKILLLGSTESFPGCLWQPFLSDSARRSSELCEERRRAFCHKSNVNQNMDSSASFGGQSPLESFQWHVYILKCADDTYYVGRTINIEDRMHRHNMGHVKYTRTRLPIQLVIFLSFPDEWKAVQMEQYLKSDSSRAFAKKHFY